MNIEKMLNLLNKAECTSKCLNEQEYYQTKLEDLNKIKELILEKLHNNEIYFWVSAGRIGNLANKIFKYSKLTNVYTWDYRIRIDKKGLKKLNKSIKTTEKKLQTINKRVEELGWLDEQKKEN